MGTVEAEGRFVTLRSSANQLGRPRKNERSIDKTALTNTPTVPEHIFRTTRNNFRLPLGGSDAEWSLQQIRCCGCRTLDRNDMSVASKHSAIPSRFFATGAPTNGILLAVTPVGGFEAKREGMSPHHTDG